MAISSVLGSSALLPAGLGFRNVLINGEFRINQRGYTSASNLASGAYGFDRWKSSFTNTTLTFTSTPQGQIVTINSGGSIKQIIERENITAGVFVLSWTGTATGRVYNTGATPPAYAASPIIVTLDGLANVEVEFTASGGTQTLWKPQLEQNRQPTPFEQRPIGVELALCQRYYWRAANTETASIHAFGFARNTTTAFFEVQNPVPMRAVVSAVEFSTLSVNLRGVEGFAVTSGSLISDYRSTLVSNFEAVVASGLTTLRPYFLTNNSNAAGYLGFSAEL